MESDEVAFKRLFDEVYPPVYRRILAVLQNPEDAEDCAQDVVIRLWQLWKNDRERLTNAVRYATVSAFHQALDVIRANKRGGLKQSTDQDPTFQVPDPRPSAVESLVLKDSIAILEDCIAKLPPHLRDVLVHRVFNEAKVKDTSVALGISIGEVSKRFSKAMARVKECGEQQAQSMPLMPPGKKVRGANVIRGDAGDF